MSSSSAREAFLDSYADPSPPPPGVVANFNDPNTNGTAYIIVAVIGLFLATFFTWVRIYTKGILTRSLGWDDRKGHFLFFPNLKEAAGGRGKAGIESLLGWRGIGK